MTELTEIRTPDLPELSEQPDVPAQRAPVTWPFAAVYALDWEKIIYIGFIALSLITRLWGLGDRVMSHDESLHTQFSWQFYRGDGYEHTPLMHGPFLFHITALFYWLFGASDFSARLPLVLFGAVLVAMPYFLRRWLGRVGALFTSFFFLISPFITYHARYIRHDIYVITWAMILVIATWHYLRTREERYIWWFAAGLALMFATKEVSFIYVAIFGSFLVIRLVLLLWQTGVLRDQFAQLRPALLVLVGAIVLAAVGFVGVRQATAVPEATATATVTAEGEQGFAADPDAELVVEDAGSDDGLVSALRWLQVAGVIAVGVGVFLAARTLRTQLDQFPEFDLIVLYSTLILPSISPFLTVLSGHNPVEYSWNRCELAGQATMSTVEVWSAYLLNDVCRQAFFSSNLIFTAGFVVLTLVISVLVGFWWRQRRWLIAAAIFHTIFFLLFTSVLTNPGGWGTGTVGSLGYWLEQQEVQRGNQPWFYYFFIVPFYEFLPLIFSLLAVRLWAQKERISGIAGYWISLLLLTLLSYSFTGWLINRPAVIAGETPDSLIPSLIAALVMLIGGLFWFLVWQRRLKARYELGRSWSGLLSTRSFTGFVPMLIWWLLLTWVAYSVAGEKMPWLSTHFVIPMALLSGWYLNEKLGAIPWAKWAHRSTWLLVGAITSFVVVLVFLVLKPLFLGQIQLGSQETVNLSGLGRFLGYVLVAAGTFYLVRVFAGRVKPLMRRRAWLVAFLLVLSALTIRFTYMANFPNADYAKEYMVYAHAAPAVKEVVMDRIEDLSWRMHGDKSLKVAWSADITWPLQWYLRDYPNRFYAGATPNAGITDYPVVVVGSVDWSNFDTFLDERDYEIQEYIFLWWPMEDYRKISWNSIFGLQDRENEDGSTRTGRGLGSAAVRRALWNIFFYRDYEQYGEVFGGTYRPSEWPLRHELRLYIRRDALANLWDYGTSATVIEPPVDPYAGGELVLTPNLVIGSGGLEDSSLALPRNVSVGPDGNLYVLDSGNHRLVVFSPDGRLLREWGGQGADPGQFNEPWGIVVDDQYVYVADTWNHRVQKFTLEGDFVTAFGQSGNVLELGEDSGGFFFGPRALALMPNEWLLVTDTGNHRIQIFDRDGNFIRTYGQQGTQPGLFNEPVGMVYSDAGWLYLADTWNARVQRFNESLLPSLSWEIDGWEGDSTENKPYMAVDSAGNVYVTDPENFRVLIFDPDGQYMGRFGQPGTEIDTFGLPNGIAIDADDQIYIADAHNNRILRFPAVTLQGPIPPAGDPAGDGAPPAGGGNISD